MLSYHGVLASNRASGAFDWAEGVKGQLVVRISVVMAGAMALALGACDDRPEDYLPRTEAAPPPVLAAPTLADVRTLRDALRRCERAMEEGADQIAEVATQVGAPAGPEAIVRVRDACSASAKAIGALPIQGRLKDPCLRAAYAREAVAAGTLRVLAARDRSLGAEALRDQIADQVSASRACASEISSAEREAAA